MNHLKTILITDFKTRSGWIQDVDLSYETFGPPLGSSPVILINHALTGNSTVTGEHGWWSNLVGKGKVIDTKKYTVLAFNIPGNGYSGKIDDLLFNYEAFTLIDIAKIFLEGLKLLHIEKLYAIIGGSIGGALTWQLAALSPSLAKYIIPLAADYKTTDWVVANCKVQEAILSHSEQPLEDARMHAMTFYRTPTSLKQKFNREKDEQLGVFKVDAWLTHHGTALKKRFKLPAYRLLNHLLTTIDISEGKNNYTEVIQKIESAIHLITINNDSFFLAEENWDAYVNLKPLKENIYIHEIKSVHGHDAFFMEYEQLQKILKPIFNTQTTHEKNKHHLVWNR